MELFILKADNSDEINNISEELSEHKFKKIQEEEHFILMKKKRYGNYYVHILFFIMERFLLGVTGGFKLFVIIMFIFYFY